MSPRSPEWLHGGLNPIQVLGQLPKRYTRGGLSWGGKGGGQTPWELGWGRKNGCTLELCPLPSCRLPGGGDSGGRSPEAPCPRGGRRGEQAVLPSFCRQRALVCPPAAGAIGDGTSLCHPCSRLPRDYRRGGQGAGGLALALPSSPLFARLRLPGGSSWAGGRVPGKVDLGCVAPGEVRLPSASRPDQRGTVLGNCTRPWGGERHPQVGAPPCHPQDHSCTTPPSAGLSSLTSPSSSTIALSDSFPSVLFSLALFH